MEFFDGTGESAEESKMNHINAPEFGFLHQTRFDILLAMENIKQQLKVIIIQGLRIKDRSPESLRDDQQLMDGDLEIDSIDILQLILEIERHFGIKLVDGDFDRTEWETINTLAAAVDSKLAVKART
jgi:acyl carrier protein